MPALLLCGHFQKMKKDHENMLHVAHLLLCLVKLGGSSKHASNENLHFALNFHMQTFQSPYHLGFSDSDVHLDYVPNDLTKISILVST